MTADPITTTQWLHTPLSWSTPPSSLSHAYFKTAALLLRFSFSIQFFLSYFGSFTPPEQTLHGCYSRQRKGKKAEKPSESCRLRGVCVVILCIYLFFFQCCRLPGERKAGKVRTDPFAQDQQLRASACLVFALGSCTSSVPRLWCGPARG